MLQERPSLGQDVARLGTLGPQAQGAQQGGSAHKCRLSLQDHELWI